MKHIKLFEQHTNENLWEENRKLFSLLVADENNEIIDKYMGNYLVKLKNPLHRTKGVRYEVFDVAASDGIRIAKLITKDV